LARLYSRKHGSSGSRRPISKRPPAWVKYDPDEVEAAVVKLAREGNDPSMIGMMLRDKFGIPLVRHITGKRMTKILSGAGVSPKMPDDLQTLLRKADGLRKHLERNRKDHSNKRALTLIESKILRLASYYQDQNVLPSDWKYKPIAASVE